MSKEKKKLVEKARSLYKRIFPCGKKVSFADCFTQDENMLFFWFDTEDHSTHMLVTELQ